MRLPREAGVAADVRQQQEGSDEQPLDGALQRLLSVRRRGCRAATGCYYVRPLSFYETVTVPPALRSAVLVGDPFYRAVAAYGSNRSLAYRSAVRDALRRRGLAVRVRPPSHPDADLAFLCGARHLLPGKGGFARIVAACVRGRGGKVYG